MLISLRCHTSMCPYNLDVACKQIIFGLPFLLSSNYINVKFLAHISLTVKFSSCWIFVGILIPLRIYYRDKLLIMLSIIYLIWKAYTFYRCSSYIPYIVIYNNFVKLFNLKIVSHHGASICPISPLQRQ